MRIGISTQRQIGSVNSNYLYKSNLSKKQVGKNRNDNKVNNHNKKSMVISGKAMALGGKKNKNNRLEKLMEQKTNLINNKSTFMEKALKRGEDPRTIKEKVKSMNEQIEKIDKEINKIQLEEQHKASGKEDKSKKSKKSENSIKDEEKKSSMDSIISITSHMKKIENLSRHRTQMVGEKRVLKSEIKIDEGRGINPVNKRKRLEKLDDNIKNIAEKFGQELNEEIKKNGQGNDLNDEKKKSGKPINMIVKKEQAYGNHNNYKSKDKGGEINIIA
ncbi:MAG: hypothetical protein N4A57_11025 [Anaeromicrobium sp.]|uniref:hypothetical protein n=1 Tax=Anaeromicrobium sp. TaxID=1929132 RepID=UPI0025D7CEB4|nr:hypothetical protein [Anaeromicrobium sp.]MCT4594784.1 hypothetical protein [Anaeromicrobium sp.]